MLNHLGSFVKILFDPKYDPRLQNWITARNPVPTMLICLSYVYVVKYLGPNLMKNRKPLDIRWFMLIYNFSMVFFNIYIFYSLGVHGWFGKYSYKCQPVDYSTSTEALAMLNAVWWYYISKMVDFTDTIIFIMRKKYSQVTTLHVVHHGIMPMSCWFGLKFTPGGHSSFFAFLNSFVHVLMYSYYGLAAIGPHMNKYLWWKKHMTVIQMIQFIMIFVHSFQLVFRSCDYPKGFVWWIGLHAVLFWYLFTDFYKNAYRKSKSTKNHERKTDESVEKLLKNSSSSMNGHARSNGISNGFTNQDELSNNNVNFSIITNEVSCSSNQSVLADRRVQKKVE